MPEILKELSPTTFIAAEGSRICVLKRILPEDRELYKRLVGVKNENLAAVTGLTNLESGLFAVREYVQGESLEELLQKSGTLPEGTVRKIAAEICGGLSVLHSLGIIHRDINPNNIIITDSGRAVIIDFGISRTKKETASKDTRILGTQGYAAPEQYGFAQTGERADIYALGVLMNVMSTGRLPNEEPAGGELGEIIKKCTEIDEKNRFADVDSLAGVLVEKTGKEASAPVRRRLPDRASVRLYAGAVYYTAVAFAAFFYTIGSDDGAMMTAVNLLVIVLIFAAAPLLFFNAFNWAGKKPFDRLSRGRRAALRIISGLIPLFSAFIIIYLISD